MLVDFHLEFTRVHVVFVLDDGEHRVVAVHGRGEVRVVDIVVVAVCDASEQDPVSAAQHVGDEPVTLRQSVIYRSLRQLGLSLELSAQQVDRSPDDEIGIRVAI